jgi:polyisoprenoid-binding protein YceI
MEAMSEAATAAAVRYVIDPRGSRMTIQAYAGGLLSAVGHNPVIGVRDLSGELSLAPDRPELSTVRLRIPTKSLTVQNDVSDKDRREIENTMHEQVLETGRYGEIAYDGTRARVETVNEGRYRVEIDGQLTLHGVTRPQRIPVQVFLIGETLRAQGEAALRQSDFNITLVSVAGGTLKIKDELKLTFDLLARKAT